MARKVARKKRNPTRTKRAERAFRRFHWGDDPEQTVKRSAPRVNPGDVLVELGPLVEVVYETHKAGKTYNWVHAFKGPLPVLAQTLDGRLVIVGGGYRVTERGIVG